MTSVVIPGPSAFDYSVLDPCVGVPACDVSDLGDDLEE